MKKGVMEWHFQAPDAHAAVLARRPLTAYLLKSCTPDSDFSGAALIFGELVSNVIRHAPGPVDISVQADQGGVVTMNICDSGNGFELEASLLAEDGLGLYIVSRLCSQLSSTRIPGGNKVSVVLPVLAKTDRLHVVKNSSPWET